VERAIEGFFHWFLVNWFFVVYFFWFLVFVVYCCLLLFIVAYCPLLWFVGNVSFYFFKAEFPDASSAHTAVTQATQFHSFHAAAVNGVETTLS
jgi:hypothetical protein